MILAARSLTQARDLLGLAWAAVPRIMDRAVTRGLRRRELEGLAPVGLAEKSFGSGQSSISLLSDGEGRRVLESHRGLRPSEGRGAFGKACPRSSASRSQPWLSTWRQRSSPPAGRPCRQPGWFIDKFHLAKHLNAAGDKVRRQEHQELPARQDETLKGPRQLWLFNPRNFSAEQAADFEELKFSGRKVARAWAIKELFSKLWTYSDEGSARKFFKSWFGWAARSKLPAIPKVAKMIKRHLENILPSWRHPMTNAVTEGLHRKIQASKAKARGFRSFENYRPRSLFFCGKLALYPL